MKLVIRLSTFFILVSILFCFCKEDEKLKPLNPNGDSELALLMREMYDDAMRMKKGIASDIVPQSEIKNIERLLSAEATEPEKQKSQEYQAFAESYIHIMNSMDENDFEKNVELYDSAVQMCKACHQSLCPGPLVRVNKLIRKNKI